MTTPTSRPPGRPRAIPQEVEEEIARGAPHVRTRRGRQNIYYRTLAEKILTDDPRCTWLTGGAAKTAVLTELGRFEDPDEMRKAARAVCRARPRPKVSDAAAMIRRRRTGAAPQVDPQVLEAQLASVTDAYLAAHPGVTWVEVQGAMDGVLEKISETLPEGKGGQAQSAKAIRRKMARLAGLRMRDVVGPRAQAELEAAPGVYLVAQRVGGRWLPVYTGNSADVQDRSKTLGPERWFRRAGIRLFAAHTGGMTDDERQDVENAIKAEFELDD